MHHTVVKQLYKLFLLGGDQKYIHAKELVVGTGTGDFSKAKYWGLIIQQDNDDTEKASNGLWKLTPIGVQFLQNNYRIEEYVHIYDDRVLRYSGNEVNVQMLTYKYFNYEELMNDRTPSGNSGGHAASL